MTLTMQLLNFGLIAIVALMLGEAVHQSYTLKGSQKLFLYVWVILLTYVYIERVVLW